MLQKAAKLARTLWARSPAAPNLLPRLATVTTATSNSTASPPGWEANEEPLTGYTKDGYLPIAIGNMVGDYRIISKLGWGQFSTVWLGQRSNTGTVAFREEALPLGALKVFKADAGWDEREIAFLQKMREQSPRHPGSNHIVRLLDQFLVPPVDSPRVCIVMEPLSESLRTFASRWPDRRLPLPLVQRITRQMLLALDYVHTECNIVHTDVKPSNIMMAMPPEKILVWALHRLKLPRHVSTLSDGREVTRLWSHGNVPYPIPPGDPSASEIWADFTAKLGDFNTACWADQTATYDADLFQPAALRAPEVCIGAPWGPPADIWSLGCTVFELALGQSMFPPDVTNNDLHTLLTFFFGDFPADMVQRGRFREDFYHADGSLKTSIPHGGSLDGIVAKRGGTPAQAPLVDFLRYLFVLDPAKRPTAKALLAHPWLN